VACMAGSLVISCLRSPTYHAVLLCCEVWNIIQSEQRTHNECGLESMLPTEASLVVL